MKNATLYGILFGFFLALGAIFGGFGGFIGVLILCTVFGALGAHLEGSIDLRDVANSLTSSSRGKD